MNVALAASGLGKRYGSTWALQDCDLLLPTGAVIALVGPNGAGKTTLLQLAAGLIRPSTGTVALLDELAPDRSPRALAQLGYVAQDHPLYRRFRVRELLHLGRSLNERWDQALAERRLAELGIPMDRHAGRLSGGEQAQLALTLALAKSPRLLILDEPVASLDPLARREFMQQLMGTVADGDLTVLLSSHNVGELERVCDHLVLVADGRVQLAGDIETLLDSHRMVTGPGAEVPDWPGVVHVDQADRHAHVLTRIDSASPMPGWEPHPVGLEELVLAYLKRSQDDSRPAYEQAAKP
ncbi:ABC transporter ATP-binding protein [Nocardioides bizhenqiangii]|uniref:ABC transporter ATP-binding protein n=1 Tax=Nocardioides bizhenqiangii TaxID=3095076 RepID=A0ABZ0ZTE5_9ACTN|nr:MULTISPECIES: ABC transporter ATP-binding protein [unclassified Nocardioides]MDZ5621731.1 ABC transporter ATP-binding protein [Nocardioides sp. HM23]WQQ27583.1 ABC transporter ATP-binding protein [Nocardioides sp. HM61]